MLPLLPVLLWLAACGTTPTPAEPARPDVVLIVLDNVRADRLSLCGHDRPTSPTLQAFAATGWSSCRAYAPGAWTLPSHASYFTGVDVPTHGAHFADAAEALVPGQKMQAHGLSDEHGTLAEAFAARGYRTVLVSANPVVSEASGLARGFGVARSAQAFGPWFGKHLPTALHDALDQGDPDAPTFLVVNIADAHVPWRPVPEGLGWVPARARLDTHKDDARSPSQRLVAGTMKPKARAAYVAHLRDVYDYAVFRADRTLRVVLKDLDARGLLDGRVAITSDHGEFLGEHDMLGHCCATLEPDARVPLLLRDVDTSSLTEPLSAATVHDLLLHGAGPSRPAAMVAGPNPSWHSRSDWFGRSTYASVWSGHTKHTWQDGAVTQVDLASDPGEQVPAPAEAPERLTVLAEAFATSLERAPANLGLHEALQELGYVE